MSGLEDIEEDLKIHALGWQIDIYGASDHVRSCLL